MHFLKFPLVKLENFGAESFLLKSGFFKLDMFFQSIIIELIISSNKKTYIKRYIQILYDKSSIIDDNQ